MEQKEKLTLAAPSNGYKEKLKNEKIIIVIDNKQHKNHSEGCLGLIVISFILMISFLIL